LDHQSTGGYQVKTNGEAEGLEGLQPRQHRKCDDRCKNGGDGGANRRTHCGSVSLIGSWRKQDHPHCRPEDGRRAIRPLSHDPEELNDADRDERAPRIDE
jgi:hypothetical protein